MIWRRDKLGETSHVAPDFVFGECEVVQGLQVHPEHRTGSKPVPKPQRGITSNRAFALHDLSDPIVRYVDLTREFGSTDAKFGKLVREDFSRMNGSSWHDCSPASVIINDLDFGRTSVSWLPDEAEAPLQIYPDAPLSLTVATQRLEAVRRQSSQVIHRSGCVENGEAFFYLPPDCLPFSDLASVSKKSRPFVVVADNQDTLIA